MNNKHFNTTKKKPNKITHYVKKNDAGAIDVTGANFFICQGGLTQKWGKAWRGVIATSSDHARAIGKEIL